MKTNQFKKYSELKEEYSKYKSTHNLLLQYLAIVQSMAKAERAYKSYERELQNWLDNFEKSIKEVAKNEKEFDGK